jgi:hypothetical protein
MTENRTWSGGMAFAARIFAFDLPAMARIERGAGVFLEPEGGGRSGEAIWRSLELLDLTLHDISVDLEGEKPKCTHVFISESKTYFDNCRYGCYDLINDRTGKCCSPPDLEVCKRG